jgi:hypothetical protein
VLADVLDLDARASEAQRAQPAPSPSTLMAAMTPEALQPITSCAPRLAAARTRSG